MITDDVRLNPSIGYVRIFMVHVVRSCVRRSTRFSRSASSSSARFRDLIDEPALA
jgi:hypothetical protein